MQLYDYSALQWALIFFIYCVLGWCFESTVVSVQQRHFVNRGFLRGPMLPIYGFGATLLLHIALPLHGHPVLLFLWSMLAATVFEYLVGVLMERLFKVKYWDYSRHRFQFQGRICLQSSLCWGAMGLLLAGVIHPPVARLVTGLPLWLTAVLVALWTAAFAADVTVSVRAALDLAKMLEELDRLREEAAELRGQLSETALVQLTRLSYRMDEARGELTERMDEAREQLSDAADDARERLSERMDETREQLADAADDARERLSDARERVDEAREQLTERLRDVQRRFEEQADSLKRSRKSLLRGNPTARSARYDDVLQKLKKHMRSR